MDEQASSANANILELTADLVASFVSKNKVPASDLTGLISQVHATLSLVGNGKSEPVPQALQPAVPIKNSVKPDYIVCLEDGKKFKTLKRHLKTTFNMTPDQYRAKWGLRFDYPMVAPAYAAKRSELAKSMGLGNLRQKAKAAKVAGKKGPSENGRARKKAKTG
jgi:predicted transcriptional regulator